MTSALGDLQHPSPTKVVETLRARVAEFATHALTDDPCLLAARFNYNEAPRDHPPRVTTPVVLRDLGRRTAVNKPEIVLLGIGGADLNAGDDRWNAGQWEAEQ